MQTLRREHWPGYSVDLGEGFRVHKDRDGRQLEAICRARIGVETRAERERLAAAVRGLPKPRRGAGLDGIVAGCDGGTRVAVTRVVGRNSAARTTLRHLEPRSFSTSAIKRRSPLSGAAANS
jgi:hypothetical protein